MANYYMTAEQATAKANELFKKGDLNLALQHFEYSYKLSPSDKSILPVILINMMLNGDLLCAMDSITESHILNSDPNLLFKAYRAVLGLYLYAFRYDNGQLSDVTRCIVEHYLENNYTEIKNKIGSDNAKLIRHMLLKVLLMSYENLLSGQVYIGEKQLPDTYNIKTEGRTYHYGGISNTKYNTTIETQKNSESQYERALDFLGETMNELNFQVRCSQLYNEICTLEPSYNSNEVISIPKVNSYLEGYLKFYTYDKMNKANKKKRTAIGVGSFFLLTAVVMLLFSVLINMNTSENNLLPMYIFAAVSFFIAIIFIIKSIKNGFIAKRNEPGEYDIEKCFY